MISLFPTPKPGDLHILQLTFSRPLGQCSTPGYEHRVVKSESLVSEGSTLKAKSRLEKF